MSENFIKPRVAIAAGENRHETVKKALCLVKDDIINKLKGRALIKPNFLSSIKKLASTQPDAVKATLEFLSESGFDMNNAVIGEGASRSTKQAFDNFGYRDLAKDFGIELIDLNKGVFRSEFEIVTETGGIHSIKYADKIKEFDTLISVAVAKTHDAAVVTLSTKNMMGCLRRVMRPRMHGIQLGKPAEAVGELLWNAIEDHSWVIKIFSSAVFKIVKIQRRLEKKIHGGASPGLHSQTGAISENLARMAKHIFPDISVIDAFEAMEGEGPGSGTPIKMKIAVAGTDPVACDAVMAYMMGFDPLSIGYLNLMNERGLGIAEMDKIQCVGENPENRRMFFKPHSNYPLQMKWRDALNTINLNMKKKKNIP